MFARYYRPNGDAGDGGRQPVAPGGRDRVRQGHRWLAWLFTALVLLNVVVMLAGRPPAWVTYAPLAPLALLMLSGWLMLARHHGSGRGRPR